MPNLKNVFTEYAKNVGEWHKCILGNTRGKQANTTSGSPNFLFVFQNSLKYLFKLGQT